MTPLPSARWSTRALALGVGVLAVAIAGRTYAVPSEVAPAPGPDEAVSEAGAWLPAAPDRLETALPPATVDRIRGHLEAGDAARALRDAERLAEERRWGRDRDAAWLVVGLLHREERRHNLASEAFTRVRSADGPLAPYAAWYEAEQDLLRGREWAAIRECEKLRATWPASDHASDCLRLVAQAHAALGNVGAARAAAAAYDVDHDTGTIGEQIELGLALRLARTQPESGVALLQRLAVVHDAPLTGRVAEEELARLRAAGVAAAELPSDLDSRMARAVSMRDSGRGDAAWAEFRAIAEGAADDARTTRWVEDNAERFGWRTREWDFLAERYGKRYEASRDPEDAWNRFRVLTRGARFDEASALALEMQAKHATSSQWRRSHEDVGRTMLLAGRYADARTQFDAVAARGGWTGRRGRFTAAFAALMAGDAADAVTRFDAVVAEGKQHTVEARYWRARALDALERHDEAALDRAWLLENDPGSWYALLVRQADTELPAVAPYARDGRWPGLPPAAAPGPLLLDLFVPPDAFAVGAPVAPGAHAPSPGFASLSWSGVTPTVDLPAAPTAEPLPDPALEPPPSYRASALWDPEAGRQRLAAFTEQNAPAWPELRAISDLARIGLYDLSGPLLSRWFEDLREASRRGVPQARRLFGTPSDQWRPLFLAARDHHHASRSLFGLWETVAEPELKVEAVRLAYPLAHDRYVWTHAREHDVDPFLVLGLMRQESTYDAEALSRAGARGAMQIMPKTGHLLADLAHDTRFTAGDLEDPTLAVGYGIEYLGMLMRRFDGVYPLAVASYNGGPFNVSSWLAGAGAEMPVDAFVEHIPFRETRDYVKKVSEGYSAYVSAYGPDGAAVVLPPHAEGDHPEVVDF